MASKRYKRALLSLVLGMLALAAAASVQAQESRIIKIISSLPRTGSANAQAHTMVNGIKMAIEEAGGKVGNIHHRVRRLGRRVARARPMGSRRRSRQRPEGR